MYVLLTNLPKELVEFIEDFDFENCDTQSFFEEGYLDSTNGDFLEEVKEISKHSKEEIVILDDLSADYNIELSLNEDENDISLPFSKIIFKNGEMKVLDAKKIIFEYFE